MLEIRFLEKLSGYLEKWRILDSHRFF